MLRSNSYPLVSLANSNTHHPSPSAGPLPASWIILERGGFLGAKTLQGRLTEYTHMRCLETGSHLCGKSQAVSIRHSWKVGTSCGWSQRLQKFPHLPAPILQTCLLTLFWASSHYATKYARRRNQEDHFHTQFTVLGIFSFLFSALQTITLCHLSPLIFRGATCSPKQCAFCLKSYSVAPPVQTKEEGFNQAIRG